MKRLKRVFTNPDQVLHLWANQSQSDARSKNVYFEGPSCYSYGRHYELGRLVQFKGQTVALINVRGYSVTTSKHIGSAFSAASHLICVGIDGFNGESDAEFIESGLLRSQGQLVETLFGHFAKLRPWQTFKVGERYGIDSTLKEFNNRCDQLGFKKLKLEPDQDFIDLFNEHVEAAKKRREELSTPEAEAKREKARERKAELELEKAANAVEIWRQGGALPMAVRSLRLNLLRINGETVETSGGAEVPLSHALRLLQLVDRGTAKQGERVGHFLVSSVGAEVIKIGCHRIALSEARAVLGSVAPALSLVENEKGVSSETI